MRVCANGSWTGARLIVAVALAGSLTTLIGSPAAIADECTGDGDIYQNGGDVVGECQVVLPGQPGDYTVHDLWAIYCAGVGPYQDGDDVGFYEEAPLEPGEIDAFGLDPTGEYAWYDVICWRDGNNEMEIQIIVVINEGVPPEVIRDIAAARLEPPPPSAETSPPLAAETYVRVPTWLWLDPVYWLPVEASETRGLTTVTVRATPTQARWAMGDGGEVTCSGPGVAWTAGASEDATDCGYTYLHSSYGEPGGRFDASVTVSWQFEWWINDVYQGVFGTVDVPAGFGIAVAEIQAIETGG